MCQHQPSRPPADAAGRVPARLLAVHPEQTRAPACRAGGDGLRRRHLVGALSSGRDGAPTRCRKAVWTETAAAPGAAANGA